MARSFHAIMFLFFRTAGILSVFSLWNASAFLANTPNSVVVQHDHSPGSTGYGSVQSHRTLLRPLAMTRNNTDESGQDPLPPKVSFGIEDQGLLACDLFAILIASQLMGLLDVLNDPEFSRNGGWLQPIPAVPSTLNALIEKTAVLSLFWFPLSTIRIPSISTAPTDASDNNGLGEAPKTVTLFCVFRLGAAVVISSISSVDFDGFDVLRDCYLVGLATISFRFLYSQYVR
jgi:hypothetical protein